MAIPSSLLVPGVIGTHTHFEATEVFARLDGQPEIINIFTLLVAEQLDAEPPPETSPYLNPERITLKSLPAWTFGIRRYVRPIARLVPAVTGMAATGLLSASGEALQVGKLREVAPQFVPANFTTAAPWNKVLKNNFWNGSHVFEWSDPQKKALQPFFEESRRLQELSDRVGAFVPISLAALSDRLGNVAVQLPVTAALITFGKLQTGQFTVNVAWHPAVPPRPLRASCELEFDGVVTGYASAAIEGPETVLTVPPGRGMYQGIVWDEANEAVMAVSGGAFINSVGWSMNLLSSEPRVFSISRADDSKETYRVGVGHWRPPTIIGDPTADDTGGYTQRRMYEDQLQRLIAERVFLQYKPGPSEGESNASHDKALGDLRALIGRYGQEGAWLWDPYLSARDILETLFFCPYASSDLRALTTAQMLPHDAASCESTSNSTGKEAFIEEQRAILNGCDSNWLGLRLEYRARRDSHGFGFHDRFLIFPRTGESALAWSLGTSVNSLGTAHHIFQKVDHGQLIRDAFTELWEELDQPRHLIWKKP